MENEEVGKKRELERPKRNGGGVKAQEVQEALQAVPRQAVGCGRFGRCQRYYQRPKLHSGGSTAGEKVLVEASCFCGEAQPNSAADSSTISTNRVQCGAEPSKLTMTVRYGLGAAKCI